MEPLKPILEERFKITLNPTAASEHVGEVERIRTLKERVRAAMSAIPWKLATPKLIVRELVRMQS